MGHTEILVWETTVCAGYTPQKLLHCPQWLVTIQLWLWDLDSPLLSSTKPRKVPR